MRLFNKAQKQIIFSQSHGVCQLCGNELPSDWHADHVVPFSKGGETKLSNSQALCPNCNIKKSNKMLELRKWQELFFKEPYKFYDKKKKSYLLHAGVGSGKTIASIKAYVEFVKDGFHVVVCSPSENIRTEWANEFNNMGYNIDDKYSFRYNYKSEYHGISITYQSLTYANTGFLISNRIIDEKTILILDEVHHLGDTKSWGDAVQAMGELAGFVLLLTGTPTRSDNVKIPFAIYEAITEDKKFKLKVDYSYSYADSVRDKICCPITFRAIDIINENTPDGYLKDCPLHRKILNSSLDTKENTWVLDVINNYADKQLDELRERMPDAGGLIVCNSIEDAKNLSNDMPLATLVTSDEDNGHQIDEFKKSDDKWIISVRMVSEGVNIPRLRVIVYATNYNTMLFFQQVAGRGVRNRNDNERGTIDHCYFYYPNFEPLVNNATEIEQEISHIVEIQENEFRLPSSNGRTYGNGELDHFDVEIGEESIINAGVSMTWLQQKYKDIIPEKVRISLERDWAEQEQKRDIFHGEPLKKSARVKEIKIKINKKAYVISLKSGLQIKDVHAELNKKISVYSTSELHDEATLLLKYNHAIEWLNTYGRIKG